MVTVKRTIDGHCCYPRHPGKMPAKQQLSVGALVTTPAVLYKDEGDRTLLLGGSPQNAWSSTSVTLKVEPTLSDTTFAVWFANPSQTVMRLPGLDPS